MTKQATAAIGYLLGSLLLAACASAPQITVPDTLPGDRILDEYMLGKWCTNRELTADTNQAAGFSGLLNVSPVFWRFGENGQWDASTSGFMYNHVGSWAIDNPDNLRLSRDGLQTKTYQARFENDEEGPNLFLVDAEGHFTVLSRCK